MTVSWAKGERPPLCPPYGFSLSPPLAPGVSLPAPLSPSTPFLPSPLILPPALPPTDLPLAESHRRPVYSLTPLDSASPANSTPQCHATRHIHSPSVEPP